MRHIYCMDGKSDPTLGSLKPYGSGATISAILAPKISIELFSVTGPYQTVWSGRRIGRPRPASTQLQIKASIQLLKALTRKAVSGAFLLFRRMGSGRAIPAEQYGGG